MMNARLRLLRFALSQPDRLILRLAAEHVVLSVRADPEPVAAIVNLMRERAVRIADADGPESADSLRAVKGVESPP